MKPEISVIYSLSRSGGTLVSRCLACMPKNLLLSEVHPRCAYYHPLQQACEWSDLFSEKELNLFVRHRYISYIDAVKLVSERCRERGVSLVIRDWTHVDFTPGRYPVAPVYRLSQHEHLAEHFHIHHIAIMRDPVDAFMSLSKLKNYREGWLSLEEYMSGCRKFAEIAAEVGYIQYEAFCDEPADSMKHICRTLGLEFDARFLDNFSSFRNITGDSYAENQQATLTGEPTGWRSSGQIKRPQRREGWEALVRQLEDNADYQRILELPGYSNNA